MNITANDMLVWYAGCKTCTVTPDSILFVWNRLNGDKFHKTITPTRIVNELRKGEVVINKVGFAITIDWAVATQGIESK